LTGTLWKIILPCTIIFLCPKQQKNLPGVYFKKLDHSVATNILLYIDKWTRCASLSEAVPKELPLSFHSGSKNFEQLFLCAIKKMLTGKIHSLHLPTTLHFFSNFFGCCFYNFAVAIVADSTVGLSRLDSKL
jgi:hypothetical protein